MQNTNTDCLVIPTGLKDSVSRSVLQSVIGQLSDGIWENSRIMNHYWPFVKVEMIDGQVCLVISKNGIYRYPNSMTNYFFDPAKMNKDGTKIKKWFADKIKAIVNQERKDFPDKGIKFNDKCDKDLCYMDHRNEDGSYNRDITVREAYVVYKCLRDSVE